MKHRKLKLVTALHMATDIWTLKLALDKIKVKRYMCKHLLWNCRDGKNKPKMKSHKMLVFENHTVLSKNDSLFKPLNFMDVCSFKLNCIEMEVWVKAWCYRSCKY